MRAMVESGKAVMSMLILAGLLITGCQVVKPKAVGKDRDIIVVADEADWYRVGALVRGVINRRVQIFFDEQIFTAEWVRSEEFPKYQKRKNLFIIGSMRDTSYHQQAGKPGAELLETIMSPVSLDSLRQAGMELIFLRDFWAHDQLVAVAAATEGELLKRLLEATMEQVYGFFDEGLDGRVRNHVYRDGKMRLDHLRRRYGWTIEIPSNFELVQEDPAGHFYRFSRGYPDRSVFIYWENNPRADMEDSSLANLRERIAGKYNDGEEVNREYTGVTAGELAGLPCRRIEGWWENNKLVLGGRFTSYCFNTEDRFYMLDTKLFAPGMDKEPWLRHLGIIASTFKVGR